MKYLKLMEGDPIECPYCSSPIVVTSPIHKEDHMDLLQARCKYCSEEFRVEVHTDERHLMEAAHAS